MRPVGFTKEFPEDEERVVYVIRLNRPYFVSYSEGSSSVCYIGSGRAWRVFAHTEGWFAKLPLLLDEFAGLEIKLARPRRRGPGNFEAYKRVESDLISMFVEKFNDRPLFNRRLGNSSISYEYAQSADVFGLGKGPGYSKPILSIQKRLAAGLLKDERE
jgi:hypothetical protein